MSGGPLVLGIETATPRGSVALVSPEGLLGELTLLSREGHSERTLPAAEHLMRLLGVVPRDLAAVAVSQGPGSFTGLRTGIAAAKGLAFALGIPLYGIPTLEVLASGAPPGDRPVCALLHARRGEAYWALFRRRTSHVEKLRDEAATPLSALPAHVPPGSLWIGDIPPAALPSAAGASSAPPHLCHPRAAVVAAAGLARLSGGAPSETETLLPLYVRPPDARVGSARRDGNAC